MSKYITEMTLIVWLLLSGLPGGCGCRGVPPGDGEAPFTLLPGPGPLPTGPVEDADTEQVDSGSGSSSITTY